MFRKKPSKQKGKGASFFIPADMLKYFEGFKKRGLNVSHIVIEFFRKSDDFKHFVKEKKNKK